MPWVVVKFLKTDEIEAVPFKWFNEVTNVVFYPRDCNKKEIEKAIRHEYEPDYKMWTPYPVELIRPKPFESFTLACGKASKACFTSDVSDVERVVTKRIPKKKFLTSSSDSESESLDNVPPCPAAKITNMTSVRENSGIIFFLCDLLIN